MTAITNASGTVLERYVYDPYGAVTVLTDAWGSRGTSNYDWRYLHQGGRYDTKSELYHFRHRDLDPVLGRWVQQDPMRYADGMSLYQYVISNPANRLDPGGTQSTRPTASEPVNPTPVTPTGPTTRPIIRDPLRLPSRTPYKPEPYDPNQPGLWPVLGGIGSDLTGVGRNPGASDSWYHCYHSCMLALAGSERIAAIFGGIRETADVIQGDPIEDIKQDIRANAAGIAIARTCPPKKSWRTFCADECSKKY